MKKIKKYYHIYIIFFMLLIMFVPLIYTGKSLIFYGDSLTQMFSFYVSGWQKFHNGTLSFWNWSNLYGANGFNDIYYYLFSPFFWITLFFKKNDLIYVFSFLTILKFILIYFASFSWLNIYFSKKLSVIGAILFTFNGWVAFVLQYNLFLDSYIFYFICLLLYEKFLKRKTMLFPLSIAYLCILNYYCAYMFIPFMIFYMYFRNYIIYTSFKKTLISFLHDGMYLMLGILVSSFILLPCASIVILAPRLSTTKIDMLSFVGFRRLYRIYSSIYMPLVYRNLEPNFLISGLVENSEIGWSFASSIFSSILIPINLTNLFFIKNKKHKKALFISYIIIFIMTLFPFFYKLMQGTFETRWFYIIVFVNIISFLIILDEIFSNKIENRKILFSILLGSFIYVCFFTISFKLDFINSDYINLMNKIVIIQIIILVIGLLSIIFKKIFLLIIIITVEAIFSFSLNIYNDKPLDFEWINYETNYQSNIGDYFNNNISGFYRVAFSPKFNIQDNFPAIQDLKSDSIYSSLYNYNQEKFLQRIKSNWKISHPTGRYINDYYCDIRFWVTTDIKELPPYGFTYHSKYENFIIYENENNTNLGYLTNNYLNSSIYESLSYLNQERLFGKYVIGDFKNENYIYDDSLEKVGEWVNINNYIIKLNNSEQGTNIIVENFGMPETLIEVYYKGNLVAKQKSFQYNFTSYYVPKQIEFDKIIINVKDSYNSYSDMNVYIQQNFDDFNKIKESNKINSLTNVKTKNDYIYSECTANFDGFLVTSIPYDQGWDVFVDGDKVDTININGGFLGCDIKKGNHIIEFKFLPKYLKEGFIITLISFIILILIRYDCFKNNRNK